MKRKQETQSRSSLLTFSLLILYVLFAVILLGLGLGAA
ncbi:hypothetical protein Nhal_0200 [Nitrosococcus halophilus Nc 4]|uniref:Uncharacterized protein n=1 Tax=Nitrosococcus halophilus (strain Nc4) TaxID=472759 RepID=D5C4Y3_NITHN|nr:hypothetical protein Nhal_0200 [Nitrosococcus halophilus Nc 4]